MKKLLLSGSFLLSLAAFSQTSISNNPLPENQVVNTGTTPRVSAFIIYPNPAHEYFRIKSEQEDAIGDVRILALDGRPVRTYQKPKPEKFFVVGIDPGVYRVEATIGEKVFFERLVIE